jgi:hypothetical protein
MKPLGKSLMLRAEGCTMIRKQVYIEARHDRMLKRRAGQRGVSESEIIREALDRIETGAVARSRAGDVVAGREAITFMRSLSALRLGATSDRTWRRVSLYEDRIGRLAK